MSKESRFYRTTFIRRALTLAMALLVPGLVATRCAYNPMQSYEADIRRTAGGIPHIEAQDFGSLGYGTGYAMAEDNLCTMADQYVTFAAQRSFYFGESYANTTSDFFYQWLIDQGQAEEEVAEEQAKVFRGAAAGYNRYLRDTGIDSLPDPTCRDAEWVREVDEIDFRRVTRTDFFMPYFKDLLVLARPPVATAAVTSPTTLAATSLIPEGKGSNGVALGSDATVGGKGILIANPHQPWSGSERFHVMHQTLPGELDVLGANLINRPQVGFGTNEHVAWTSTVSKAPRYTFYMLILMPGNPTQYIFDGVPYDMIQETVTIEVHNPDGSVGERTHTFYSTHFGAYLVGGAFPWTDQTAFAARFAEVGWRGVEAMLDQYQATSVHELKEVHNRMQFLPVNLVAADAAGETLYTDPGAIPNLTDVQIANCEIYPGGPLAASSSFCMWGTDADAAAPGIFGPANQPHLFRFDYVTNSNDSYWLTNPNQPLTGYNGIFGSTSGERTLRTRSGLDMVEQRLDGSDGLGGTKFTLEQAQTITLSNRNKAGELLRDGLVDLCDANPIVDMGDGSSVDISEACDVLAAWNLRSDLDSRGAALFRETMAEGDGERNLPAGWNYLTPYDPADPVNTPRDLDPDDNPDALLALATAVQRLRDASIGLDEELGDVQYVVRDGEVIPMHGGEEYEGVFNKMSMSFQGADGYPEVDGSSSSWIQATEFTNDGPVVRGILTYSLSTNPESAHFADQTKMLSNKEWLDIPFRPEDVRAAALEKTYLAEGMRDCFRGGWADFEVPTFENQGQCVMHFVGLRNVRMKEIFGRRK